MIESRSGWLRDGMRHALTLGVLSVPPLAAYIAVRCYRAEARSFRGQRHPVDHRVVAEALGAVENIAIRCDEGRLRGAYAPSRNRAAVLLCHGSGSDRHGLLVEARALHQHGFGVLLLDLPGHGESEGTVRWSAREVQAVRAAVDYLSLRSDVDAARIGILGFSMGGYIAAIAAAEDDRLRAVVVIAAPPDARTHTLHEYRRWTAIGQRAALLALERQGMELDGPTPVRELARIAPRPLLVIGGTHDPVVPASMLRALYEAAREPKQLLLVAGAGHGDFAATSDAGAAYLATLVTFFERSFT